MSDMPDLTKWVDQASAAVGLPDAAAVNVAGILDMTRVVAHGVARPAGAVAAFIAGYAAGLRGGGSGHVAWALTQVTGEVANYDAHQ